MAHINLLPWRAERRKQREREFFMQLGAAFVAAILVVLLWSFWMDARIGTQNDRNAYLQNEIKQLDERITKIKDLEKVRESLLARKQIIEQLQANRSQMVHLFDELVKTIPASARLNGLKQSGDSMTLDGVAQSNASVAEYMRNIESSPWMGHADLRKTERSEGTKGGDTRLPYAFGLDVALNRPKTDENGEGADDGHAPASTGPAAAPAHAATAPHAQPAKASTAAPAPVAAPKPAAPATNGGAKA
ncbi:type IV pilus assembly protein PilN [Dyella jiangningensis]|uniref:PilN domain-containing protein n=1 Tax=Dyella sp. AtDHG13 TaxID=1938897 RepID=UPI000892492F|nr:PilN domain-containing protein [Dyella sp. AtDHG13]PXV59640.1 type IV pilus assembly protein PilN [Dyella sp. AtDHG13]SDJ28933.1 type IV pilus assembly protein PilN [Dyella jiangningensis]